MKVQRSERATKVSYSFNSIFTTSLLVCVRLLKNQLSLISSLGVLGLGAILLIYSCINLRRKLGICPTFYHSTSCKPELKKGKIVFKSSRVLELGIINGIIDSFFVYFYTQTDSCFFIFGFPVLSVLSLLVEKKKYLVSDIIGLVLLYSGSLLYIDYGLPDDYFNQIFFWLFFCKILVLNKLQKYTKEIKTLTIISSITQGFTLTAYCFFFMEIGEIEHGLLSFILVLLSYGLIESSNEKISAFYSIVSLQVYSFNFYYNLISYILSGAGVISLLIGFKICLLCPTRLNFSITSSALNQSFLESNK